MMFRFFFLILFLFGLKLDAQTCGPSSVPVVVVYMPHYDPITNTKTMVPHCVIFDPLTIKLDVSTNPPTLRLIVHVLTFVYEETPQGIINGSNTTFTIATIPVPIGSLHLFRNGLLQKLNTDYSVSGNSIIFTSASVPNSGDILIADYLRL